MRKIKLYLLVPCAVIVGWFFYALFHRSVWFYTLGNVSDLTWMWYTGKQVLIDPSELYAYNALHNSYYLPAFSIFAAIFLAPFPLIGAHYVLSITNIVLGILFVFELNKIYKLLGLKEEWKRFILLMISVCSWMVYGQFFAPQNKLIVAIIFVVSIRVQIQSKLLSTKKGYIYYFLMIFALSIAPYFVFIFLILLLDDIKLKDFFKKESIKKFMILALFVAIQNYLYFIYPHFLFDGLIKKGLLYGVERGINTFWLMDSIYLFINVPLSTFLLFSLFIGNIIIKVFKMKLEIKIALSGLIYIWCGGYGWSEEFIPMCFILFLFIPFLKKEKSIKKLLKNQKLVSLCLIIMFIINMLPVNVEMYYRVIPFLINQPFLTIIILRYVILLTLHSYFLPIEIILSKYCTKLSTKYLTHSITDSYQVFYFISSIKTMPKRINAFPFQFLYFF